MEEERWIVSSGQRWKLMMFYALMAPWGVVFGAMILFGVESVGIGLMLSTLALAVIGLSVLMLSIRCPDCRGNVGWFALSKRPIGQWLNVLRFSRQCPMCKRARAAIK